MTDDNINKKSKIRIIFSSLLPLFVLGHFSHHLLTALPGPMLPFIRDEFRLDYTRAGFVLAAFNIAYGVSQLPAGWLADRLGPRVLMLIGICGVALAGVLVSFSSNYILMLVFLAIMGVAGGGYHPAAAPLVSTTLEPHQRGQALGFHTIGGSFSFFLSPLLAAAIAGAWGWRSSFLVLAIPTMILGIILYILLARHASTSRAQLDITRGQEDEPTNQGNWRNIIALMVLIIFTQSMLWSFATFIPIFMVDNFGVAEEVAAIFLSIFCSAGMWASPLGGHLSDRFGKVRVLLICCLFIGPLIYLLGLVPYGGGVSIGALVLVLGALLYVLMPTTESYLVECSPAKHRSTVLGAYYFLAIETGGIWAPLIGFLFDRLGFNLSFTVLGGAVLVLTGICSVFLRSRRN